MPLQIGHTKLKKLSVTDCKYYPKTVEIGYNREKLEKDKAMTVYNNVWNKLNPWNDYHCSMDILDPYTMGQLLLEMECNTPDHSAGNIRKQAVSEMRGKLATAIEIIDQLCPVLEIYLTEKDNPYDDCPDLYMQDDHGIASIHIKKLPYGSSNGNILVSYRGYLAEMNGYSPDSQIPAWNDLQDYFVKGEYI